MKTSVRVSSIENHYINQDDLIYKSKAEIIASWVKRQSRWVTRREISQGTGIETATVSGRVNALVADRTLVECDELHKRPCPVTGRTVLWLIHKDNMAGQRDLFGGAQ